MQTALMYSTLMYGEHHLPTGPKSSVAYGIKSDHKQNTKNREGRGVKIKEMGVKM